MHSYNTHTILNASYVFHGNGCFFFWFLYIFFLSPPSILLFKLLWGSSLALYGPYNNLPWDTWSFFFASYFTTHPSSSTSSPSPSSPCRRPPSWPSLPSCCPSSPPRPCSSWSSPRPPSSASRPSRSCSLGAGRRSWSQSGSWCYRWWPCRASSCWQYRGSWLWWWSGSTWSLLAKDMYSLTRNALRYHFVPFGARTTSSWSMDRTRCRMLLLLWWVNVTQWHLVLCLIGVPVLFGGWKHLLHCDILPRHGPTEALDVGLCLVRGTKESATVRVRRALVERFPLVADSHSEVL